MDIRVSGPPAQEVRGRPRRRRRRLPAADDGPGPGGEPPDRDRRDQPRPQDPGPRARGARHRPVAALPQPRVTHGQDAAAVGPARVGLARAGRRRGAVHLPRVRVQRRGPDRPGRRRARRRGQAPERPDRQGQPAVLEAVRGASRTTAASREEAAGSTKCSTAYAKPSSSLLREISLAAFFARGSALPMAMLRPEWSNIRMSLGWSPMVAISVGLELVMLGQVEGDRTLVGLRVGDVEVVGLGGRRRHVVAELLDGGLGGLVDGVVVVADPDQLDDAVRQPVETPLHHLGVELDRPGLPVDVGTLGVGHVPVRRRGRATRRGRRTS